MQRLTTFLTASTIAFGVASSALALTPTQQQKTQNLPESLDTIKIVYNGWTATEVMNKIFAKTLGELGYNAETVASDYVSQFPGLMDGDLHFNMEIAVTSAVKVADDAFATGKIENLGRNGLLIIEDWWYPTYMEEKCPGLPEWEALLDAGCAEAFSTPETAPNGRFVGPPLTWVPKDEERIAALKLPFTAIYSGSGEAMFAELKSAYSRKAPVIIRAWTPHWVPSTLDGKFIKFPEFEPGCVEDPAWGINPELTYDCGKPHGWELKAAWSGASDKWPAAVQVARNFNMTNDMLNEAISEIEVNGVKVDDFVEKWMAENEAIWRPWITNGIAR